CFLYFCNTVFTVIRLIQPSKDPWKPYWSNLLKMVIKLSWRLSSASTRFLEYLRHMPNSTAEYLRYSSACAVRSPFLQLFISASRSKCWSILDCCISVYGVRSGYGNREFQISVVFFRILSGVEPKMVFPGIYHPELQGGLNFRDRLGTLPVLIGEHTAHDHDIAVGLGGL